MRFKRYIDFPFEDTRRKRLALARRQRLDREKIPLFADLVAAGQKDADMLMRERAEAWERQTASQRAQRAADWRRARARLRSYGDNLRPARLAYWQGCKWPADPSYLLSMMHMFDDGRLDISYIPRPFGDQP